MKKFLLALSLVLSLGAFTPALVFAVTTPPAETPTTPTEEETETPAQTPKESVCEGVGLTSGTADNTCADPEGGPSVDGVIRTVINVLSLIVGLASVIMIIIGGLKYVTSAGDANSINSAKNTILYAVIGLVVVLMAQFIVRFVIKKVTETPVDETTSLHQPASWA